MRKIRSVIIFLIVVSSCEYENYESIESTLLRGSWEIYCWDKYFLTNDTLDSIQSIEFTFSRSFNFESDGLLYCEDMDTDTVISGTWQIDSTGTHLYSNIGIIMSRASGIGFIYYLYPFFEITDYNRRHVYLKTPTSRFYFGDLIEHNSYEEITIKRN